MPTSPAETSTSCLIIGGGPAGLTAAIYLARFHLPTLVVDAGASRAALIPHTRNHAGFPEGISGVDLLTRMRDHAELYGASLRHDAVEILRRDGSGFVAQTATTTIRASAVLLASGVVNRRPAVIDDACHDRALATGFLRYCPICDGYEVTDRKVAVMGTGDRGTAEALFLRSYTADVTLFAPTGGHQLNDDQRASLQEAGVTLRGSCQAIGFCQRDVAGLAARC